jgi:hypothetical protein
VSPKTSTLPPSLYFDLVVHYAQLEEAALQLRAAVRPLLLMILSPALLGTPAWWQHLLLSALQAEDGHH